MRESLFRAAQRAGYFLSEEPVGANQDHALSSRIWSEAFARLALQSSNQTRESLILWPYPKGTADCIDRANCASHFVDRNPDYVVVTDWDGDQGLRRGVTSASRVIAFVPFDMAVRHLECSSTAISLCGRECSVIASELTLPYLLRGGLLSLADTPADLGPNFSAPSKTLRLQTNFVNASSYACFKGHQTHLFADYCRDQKGLRSLPFFIARSVEELSIALGNACMTGDASSAVVRPFGASQGTGVMFVQFRSDESGTPDMLAAQVLEAMNRSVKSKYGSGTALPVTVTPFVESRRIHGCLTDLRVFVAYDPKREGLAALPGMVRRSQSPYQSGTPPNSANALTNLNAPPAADALSGPRIFPLANRATLDSLGVSPAWLVDVCRHAVQIWERAFTTENGWFQGANSRQFAYGSVDFVISLAGDAIPIEINGANVGSHPTVHPRFIDAFGDATTSALGRLGLGD